MQLPGGRGPGCVVGRTRREQTDSWRQFQETALQNAKNGRERAHCASKVHVSYAFPIGFGGRPSVPGIRRSPRPATPLLANLGLERTLETYDPDRGILRAGTSIGGANREQHFSSQ